MSIARRFLTGFRQTETNEPGLELNEDGTVDLVNPDGSRTALPGGSLPAQWTADSHGALTLNTDNPVGNDILRIDAPAGYHQSSGDGYLLHVFAGDGTDVLNFDPSGALYLHASPEEGTTAFVSLDDGGQNSTKIQAGGLGNARIDIRGDDSNRPIFRVLPTGAVQIGATAEPADGYLDAGSMVIWLDATNGAAKLKVKAKTADGTVVNGSVNLT